jgi:hypothetical protein
VSDHRLENLASEFSQLAPDDQEQVLDLIARLRGKPPDPGPEAQRDVSFMDFQD